jgi:hypothetical protein
MRVLLPLALAAALAAAEGIDVRHWKSETKRVEKDEKRFWNDFQKRWNEASQAFDREWLESRKNTNEAPNPVGDYRGYEKLYEDYAAIQAALGMLDAELAKGTDAKAADALLDELLDVTRRAEQLDAEILKGRPMQGNAFDQRPSIERHGLAVRQRALVGALAACPAAATFLADTAYAQAASKDG